MAELRGTPYASLSEGHLEAGFPSMPYSGGGSWTLPFQSIIIVIGIDLFHYLLTGFLESEAVFLISYR